MVRGILLFSFFCHSLAFADLESATTLPKGVYSPKVSYTVYSGLEEKFNRSGEVESVTEQYKLNLTGKNLAVLSSDLKRMVDILNSVTPAEKMGDNLSLGRIEFKSQPQVNYVVPQFAYGITDRVTLGVGIPIIHFRNDMQIVTSGKSNVDAIRAKTTGIAQELDDGLTQLSAASRDLEGSIQGIIQSKGYKPIRTVDYTTVGDTVLSSLINYYSSDNIKLAARPYFQLPTGRKDDPDDLVDTAMGGQPAFGAYSIHDLYMTRKLVFGTSAGYQLNFQDQVEMRVPGSSSDVLPGPETKETLNRQTGNSTFLEGGLRYTFFRALELSTYYVYLSKDSDRYEGSRNKDYSVLSKDTDSKTQTVKGRAEYSTIDAFTNKKFAVPFIVGYVYGNTVAATNSPKVSSHELYLRMFF